MEKFVVFEDLSESQYINKVPQKYWGFAYLRPRSEKKNRAKFKRQRYHVLSASDGCWQNAPRHKGNISKTDAAGIYISGSQ